MAGYEPSDQDLLRHAADRDHLLKRVRSSRDNSTVKCCACVESKAANTYFRTPCSQPLCHTCININVEKGNVQMLGPYEIRCPVCESDECVVPEFQYTKVCTLGVCTLVNA